MRSPGAAHKRYRLTVGERQMNTLRAGLVALEGTYEGDEAITAADWAALEAAWKAVRKAVAR